MKLSKLESIVERQLAKMQMAGIRISNDQNVVGGFNVFSADGEKFGFVKRKGNGWFAFTSSGKNIGGKIYPTKEAAAQAVVGE
jgi:hypothetical protein